MESASVEVVVDFSPARDRTKLVSARSLSISNVVTEHNEVQRSRTRKMSATQGSIRSEFFSAHREATCGASVARQLLSAPRIEP
jgi:hypothetical protein